MAFIIKMNPQLAYSKNIINFEIFSPMQQTPLYENYICVDAATVNIGRLHESAGLTRVDEAKAN